MTTYFREHCSRCDGKGSTITKRTNTRNCNFGTCTQTSTEMVKQRCFSCSGHGYLVLKLYPERENLLDVNDYYDYAPQKNVKKKFIAVKVNGRDEIYNDWHEVRRILEKNSYAKWKVFNNVKDARQWLDPFKFPPNGQRRFITDYMK